MSVSSPFPRIEAYLRASSLEALWAQLHADLKRFSIEKIRSGMTLRRPANGNFTPENSQVPSSSGPDFDSYLLNAAAFKSGLTTQWAIGGQGAFSWGLTRWFYESDRMNRRQIEVHERSGEFGIVNGYTVGLKRRRASLVSGYGLCAEDCMSQSDLDALWFREGHDIVGILSVFETCALSFPHISPEEEPSPRQREVRERAGNGKTIHEIARILSPHPSTVAKQMNKARETLDISTTVQAFVRATMHGQIYR